MKVLENKSAQEFLELNESILLENESKNNLMLGLAANMINGKTIPTEPLFFTFLDDEKIVGQGLRTNTERPLILTDLDDSAVKSIISFLEDKAIRLHGVIAPVQTGEAFVELWKEEAKLAMKQGIYELTEVVHPDYHEGGLELVTKEIEEIALKFCTGFVKDCFPETTDPIETAKQALERHLKFNMLYAWKNSVGDFVSIVGCTRHTKNSACISWVYTPDELRGQGYASRAVAAYSQKLLDEGVKKCNLFTDLLNPTSNSIYQKVGYKKIGESIHYEFLREEIMR